MPALSYLLTYAGTPFVSDKAAILPTFSGGLATEFHRNSVDLLDEVNRLIPFSYLQDFAAPHSYPNRMTDALGMPSPAGLFPTPAIRVGDWYYPNTASRWSVFRGLATSAMIKVMMTETAGGGQYKPFVMKSCPISPDNPNGLDANYTITTNMRMLPPRPLGEHGGNLQGLYLVTLVDERFDWQHKPATLHPTGRTTWTELFQQLATLLNITLTFNPAIDSAAGGPEPDSQLWSNAESVSLLLDALAYNVGCCVVRNYDGSYVVMDPLASRTIANTNRGDAVRVVRLAGGDLFTSGVKVPVGNLTPARNSVIPANIAVTFPKYIQGDDPVPHFLNPRGEIQRPSAWEEDSYGDVHTVTVPITSGTCYSGSQFSGVSGVGTQYIHNTAKALYASEATATGNPLNQSGLVNLAMFLAKDRYDSQAAIALDEVYPGTYAWTPEGVHDLLWTYSDRIRLAGTRVMRGEWNSVVSEMQHRTPAISGYTSIPKGVGGPSIAQSWRGGQSGSQVSTNLSGGLSSGGMIASLTNVDNLPVNQRWKGRIENEIILFEGTSNSFDVGIVQRGIDGTLQVAYAGKSAVTPITPQDIYGVNFVRFGAGQHVYPSDWTSGGIYGVNVVPQLQTVNVFSASGILIKGQTLYSGKIEYVDPFLSGPQQYTSGGFCWVYERNGEAVHSGKRYDGQFVGWTASGPCSPLYAINGVASGGGGGSFSLTSGCIQSGHIGNAAVNSGNVSSGQLSFEHMTSGALFAFLESCCCDVIVTQSGEIVFANGMPVSVEDPDCATPATVTSGSVISGTIASGTIISGLLASGLIRSFHPNIVQLGPSGQPTPAFVVSGVVNLQFLAAYGFRVSGFDLSGTAQVSMVEAYDHDRGTVSDNAQRWIQTKTFAGDIDSFVYSQAAVFEKDIGFNLSGVTSTIFWSGQTNVSGAGSAGVYWGLNLPAGVGGIQTTLRMYAATAPFTSLLSGIPGLSGASFYGMELGTTSPAFDFTPPQFRIADSINTFASGWNVTNSGGHAGMQFRAGWMTKLIPLESGTLLGTHSSGGMSETVHVGSGLLMLRPSDLSGRPVLGIGSGQITSLFLGSGAITSGTIASGSIGGFHLASGAVKSGHIGNAAVVSGSIASGQIGTVHIFSGGLGSGAIGSGQISWAHLASGAIRSGHIGNGAVVSGSIASGQIGTSHLASGTIPNVAALTQWTAYNFPYTSGINSGVTLDSFILTPLGSGVLLDAYYFQVAEGFNANGSGGLAISINGALDVVNLSGVVTSIGGGINLLSSGQKTGATVTPLYLEFVESPIVKVSISEAGATGLEMQSGLLQVWLRTSTLPLP